MIGALRENEPLAQAGAMAPVSPGDAVEAAGAGVRTHGSLTAANASSPGLEAVTRGSTPYCPWGRPFS